MIHFTAQRFEHRPPWWCLPLASIIPLLCIAKLEGGCISLPCTHPHPCHASSNMEEKKEEAVPISAVFVFYKFKVKNTGIAESYKKLSQHHSFFFFLSFTRKHQQSTSSLMILLINRYWKSDQVVKIPFSLQERLQWQWLLLGHKVKLTSRLSPSRTIKSWTMRDTVNKSYFNLP